MNATTTTLLSNSEIVFHTATDGTEFCHTKQTPDEQFGILRLKTDPAPAQANLDPHTRRDLAIIFTIDTSASMTDYCSDNKRKLDHAIQTLIGIMQYLAAESSKSQYDVYVAVIGFSTRVKRFLEFAPITPETLQPILDKIAQIRAQDSTNIELALNHADKMLSYFAYDHPNAVLHHIQLTDGEVTDGEADHDKLAQLVNPNYSHVFVGFGKYHDDQLLCRLSENPRNDYRFIDKLEYSAVVYGEILYNILYHCMDEVTVELRGGAEIYDWRTNQWGSSLVVSNLPYDCERVFQLRAPAGVDPCEVTAEVAGTVVHCYPDLVDMATNERDTNDLTRYSFRQRTQELLYEVREAIQKQRAEERSLTSETDTTAPLYLAEPTPEPTPKQILYEKCRTFMRTMKEYMASHELNEDRFMRLLKDDIFVILKTLFRRNAHMWCTSRQISLGRGHSYQPTQFDDAVAAAATGVASLDLDAELDAIIRQNNISMVRPPPIRRSRRPTYTTRDPPVYTFPLFEHPLNTPDMDVDLDGLDTNYEMSQNFDMTAMSPSLARTVGAVASGGTTIL